MDAQINLLRTTHALSPELTLIFEKFRTVSLFISGGILVIGCITGLIYGGFHAVYIAKAAEKEQLVTVIQSQKVKEGLLLSLKERVSLVTEELQAQRSWAPVLDDITSIATPPGVLAISVGDDFTVSLTFAAQPIETTAGMIQTAQRLITQKRVKDVRLNSLQLDKDGNITIGLQFQPIFIKQ